MPTPRGRVLPIIIVAAAGAVAVGFAAIADRIVGSRDLSPAPPGTPQVTGADDPVRDGRDAHRDRTGGGHDDDREDAPARSRHPPIVRAERHGARSS